MSKPLSAIGRPPSNSALAAGALGKAPATGRSATSIRVSWLYALAAAVLTVPPAVRADELPPSVRAHLRWVTQGGDNQGSPFIVIDKRLARLWLFEAGGQAVGNTPVLLGMAHGDASVPGIGERPMEEIRPDERTTPAGRFIAEPGFNASGEDIFWVDYDAAVSMHRVRANHASERRLQRLATPTPADNRISYGCINVPAAFYEGSILPRFAQQRSVIYILPETMPAQLLFTLPPARPERPRADEVARP